MSQFDVSIGTKCCAIVGDLDWHYHISPTLAQNQEEGTKSKKEVHGWQLTFINDGFGF